MHKEIAVKLHNISKVYKLYDKPVDRLKESLHPLKKKYHKEFYALKNINLEIKKGEVLGIVGVNGAGKSTLLKIIAGVLTPSKGRITINGKLNAILELSSGLKGEMTGRQNIKRNLQINQIDKNVKQLTQEIIEFADIGEHIDQPVKTYSSGMKSRLGFGIATSTDPDILIVDEVLAVGDVLFKRKCYNRIENLFQNGKTVIFVSHSAQSVVEFCSNAILLYDKEIILMDTPKKVTDFYQKLVSNKGQEKTLNKLKSNKRVILSDSNTRIKKDLEIDSAPYLKILDTQPSYINREKASFYDMFIVDNNLKKINILKVEQKYTLYFKIKYHQEIENILYGIQIKDIKGLLITGFDSKTTSNDLISVKDNEEYQVSIDFYCNLQDGDYFILLYTSNSDQNFRVVMNDAYRFQVNNKRKKFHGIVSMEHKIKIKRVINE